MDILYVQFNKKYNRLYVRYYESVCFYLFKSEFLSAILYKQRLIKLKKKKKTN